MSSQDQPERKSTERAPDEQVPGETTTGGRPGGREAAGSPTPGGAVPGEIGRVPGVPGEGDPAADADLGSSDGDTVRDVAERVRDADPALGEES